MENTFSNPTIRTPLRPGPLFFRGAIALAFAALSILFPGPTLIALSLWVGAFLIVDGVAALFARSRPSGLPVNHGWAMLTGVLGIVAGALTFINPIGTVFALSMLLGIWAVFMGGLAVAGSLQMRKDPQISRSNVHLMGVTGVASIVLGGIILFRPALGTFTLITLVSLNAILIGIASFALGFQMRRCLKTGECPPGFARDERQRAA